MRCVLVTLVALATAAGVTACGSSPEATASGRPVSPGAQPAPAAAAAAVPTPASTSAGAGVSAPAEGPATKASASASSAPGESETPPPPPPPPTSAATAPPAQPVASAGPTDSAVIHGLHDTAVTKAIELRVEGVETAAEIGGRHARPGYEFVIVDTLWKNIIPLKAIDKKANASPTGGLGGFSTGRRPPPEPGDVTMEPTMYVVSMPKRQFWLFSDDRFGEMPDPEAHDATPDHLPLQGFSIAKLDDTLRGKVVFEAPADANYRTFQYYDTDFGYAQFALGGTKPAAPLPTLGAARANGVLQLALTDAAFQQTDPPPSPGLRSYVIGLRGRSLSFKDIVDVQFQQFVFALTDRGCIAQPEPHSTGLSRPFGDIGSFPPTGANEGQVTFLLPDDTKSVKVLFRPSNGGPIDLAAGADFTPTWPTPAHTFVDGTTMRVHLLPPPPRPATLAPPAEGRKQVLLDVAIENLVAKKGIEFQTVQLRLALASGGFVDPSPLSAQLPCRLDGAGVIPAGGVRRFQLVYDVAADAVARVNFRGFELNEETADLP